MMAMMRRLLFAKQPLLPPPFYRHFQRGRRRFVSMMVPPMLRLEEKSPKNRLIFQWLLIVAIFIFTLPMVSCAGKGGSTKTYGDGEITPPPLFEDDEEADSSSLSSSTTSSTAPSPPTSTLPPADNATSLDNNNNKAPTLLRSGIVQHAVASGSSGSSHSNSDSSSSSASAMRDRDGGGGSGGGGGGGGDSGRKMKMAATHGSKSRGNNIMPQQQISKYQQSSDNQLFYGPVPGVDAAKFDMLYNRTSEEMKIKRMLLYTGLYDKTSRPVTQDKDNVTVHIGISLYHILDTNEKYQTISLLIAVRLKWRDAMLRWDPSEFKGVEQIWLPSDLLWTPDIVINNNADHEVKMQTNAIVEYTGDILWMYPQLAKIYCTLDVRNFPFDVQHCDIKFFSWTYNGYQIDLMTTESENPSYFDEANQEWNVVSIRGKRNVAIYACCPEPFPDISFTLIMKRRSMFYIFNLIFPCMLIYAVAFLGFFLPIESNEKINLEVTILLALVVFLMVIGETMPPSPDAIPLLGMLYASTMMMVSIALVSAVAVTNVYYKEKYGEQVPRWLFRLLYWNADLPCPKCKMPQRMLRSAQFDKSTGMASKKPFKNTSFMMAPQHGPFPPHPHAADYSVQGVDMMPSPQSPFYGPAADHSVVMAGQSGTGPHNSPSAFPKSPAHRRAAWIKASSMHNQTTSLSAQFPLEHQSTAEGGTTQCTSLNQQVSMCSDDELTAAVGHAQQQQRTQHLQLAKKRSGAESPVWKHRGNGAPVGSLHYDVYSQHDPSLYPPQQYPPHYQPQQQQQLLQPINQYHQQNANNYPSRPSSQAAVLSAGAIAAGATGQRSTPATFVRQLSEGGHSTRFVRTDAGCVHITISWREIAERIDGILFWAFLVSSIVVFTLIFVTVDYEDPVPGK